MDTFFNVLYNILTSVGTWSAGLWLVLCVINLLVVFGPFVVLTIAAAFNRQWPWRYANDMDPNHVVLGAGWVVISMILSLSTQGLYLGGTVVAALVTQSFAALAPIGLAACVVGLVVGLLVALVAFALTVSPPVLLVAGVAELFRDFSNRAVPPSWSTRMYVVLIYWTGAAFLTLLDLVVIPGVLAGGAWVLGVIGTLVFLTLAPLLFQLIGLFAGYGPFFSTMLAPLFA